jgi:hypothetical protein
MGKDYSFTGFYRADQLTFSTEGATCLKCGKAATYFNFQDALCENCIALVFGPPRDSKESSPNMPHQSRVRNSLEWLLFVKRWGDWKGAIGAYVFLLLVLALFWGSVLSEMYPSHSWVVVTLTVIASPASLLASLAFLRLMQHLRQPLLFLATLALKIALLVCGVWLAVYLLPRVFPESPWAYALRYGTDASRVQVSAKPADCDFLHAPVGFKGCHYEKSVQVTRYDNDEHTHRPIVSYDDGKTWSSLAADQKSGSPEVYVSWDRVPDTN